MKERFYELGATFANKWYWGQVKYDIYNEYYLKGMQDFKGCIEVEIDAGTTPGDFLWNSHNLIIVNNKELDIWKQFEKFDTYKVKTYGKAFPKGYKVCIL